MVNNNNESGTKVGLTIFIMFIIFGFLPSFSSIFMEFNNTSKNDGSSPTQKNDNYSDKVFSIITTPENKALENTIKEYADDNDFEVEITYADNLEIVSILNNGRKFDAVWSSNSIWLDMLDSSVVKTSNLKSTSITPIVFGIKKSKAQELGLIGKDVTMNDLLTLIANKQLSFSMANPVTTNSGASAFLNIISTLAGNPEVLTSDHIHSKDLKDKLITFFSGLERTSGDEDFLETSFINGDYDAAVSYESSIININKKLAASGKETLYLIYPVDGVSISDSPLVYINNGYDDKKEKFLDFQSYILSSEGQKILTNLGRRTWYGGINPNADKKIFNPEWGIDTNKYISPVKYPSKDVIKEALFLYQTEFRKPVHVVFCLDYSGSMRGSGINQLKEAMAFILGEKAKDHLIQFSEKDKIDVLIFNEDVNRIASGTGAEGNLIMDKINGISPYGGTALYPGVRNALSLLSDESGNYNLSIIVMTDGEGNIGYLSDVERTYSELGKEIPIYSITFGEAVEEQLNSLAYLSNGKVFDGKTDLVEAFKKVRGYN